MKFKSGGIIKLQNAGVLPRWMQKLNSWSMPESDESAGERIFNSTIKAANNASTQEERDKIYLDSAKRRALVGSASCAKCTIWPYSPFAYCWISMM